MVENNPNGKTEFELDSERGEYPEDPTENGGPEDGFDPFSEEEHCPECSGVRPFGKECLNCGYTPSFMEDEDDKTPKDPAGTAEPLIDRVIFVLAVGKSEAVATPKAIAGLRHRSEDSKTGSRDDQLQTFSLVKDLEAAKTAFKTKWGTLPDAARLESDTGEALVERIIQNGTAASKASRSNPLIYDEYGNEIGDPETLNVIKDGTETLPNSFATSDTVWVFPAIAYKTQIQPEVPPDRMYCRECVGLSEHAFAGKVTHYPAEEVDHDHPDIKNIEAERNVWVCLECQHAKYEPASDDEEQGHPPEELEAHIGPGPDTVHQEIMEQGNE